MFWLMSAFNCFLFYSVSAIPLVYYSTHFSFQSFVDNILFVLIVMNLLYYFFCYYYPDCKEEAL